jgi:hypothetical protein
VGGGLCSDECDVVRVQREAHHVGRTARLRSGSRADRCGCGLGARIAVALAGWNCTARARCAE